MSRLKGNNHGDYQAGISENGRAGGAAAGCQTGIGHSSQAETGAGRGSDIKQKMGHGGQDRRLPDESHKVHEEIILYSIFQLSEGICRLAIL
jgi:hypothetical protein